MHVSRNKRDEKETRNVTTKQNHINKKKKNIKSHGVVSVFECFKDVVNKELNIVMPLLPGGDCLQLLNDAHSKLPEKLVARCIQHLLLATEYCHERGILHRDINGVQQKK